MMLPRDLTMLIALRLITCSDLPDDVREPELHAEFSASSVDIQSLVAEKDSGVRPSRQLKPPCRYVTWVTD